MNKYLLLLKTKAKDIIIGALVVGLGYVIYTINPNVVPENVADTLKESIPTKVEEVKTPLQVLADKKPVKCEPVKELVLPDSLIAKNMNLFVADLNNYTVKDTSKIRAYFTKEDMLCVKRELIPKSDGKVQVYMQICEPLDKLHFNKDVAYKSE